MIGKAGSSDCADYSYINADSPEESLIYTKLDDDPPCGSQMPFSGEKFTDAALTDLLKDVAEMREKPVPADELPLEFMMNALRLNAGVPAALFEERGADSGCRREGAARSARPPPSGPAAGSRPGPG